MKESLQKSIKLFAIISSTLFGLNLLWFLLTAYWVFEWPGSAIAESLSGITMWITIYIAEWPALILDAAFPSFQAESPALAIVIVFTLLSAFVWTILIENFISLKLKLTKKPPTKNDRKNEKNKILIITSILILWEIFVFTIASATRNLANDNTQYVTLLILEIIYATAIPIALAVLLKKQNIKASQTDGLIILLGTLILQLLTNMPMLEYNAISTSTALLSILLPSIVFTLVFLFTQNALIKTNKDAR